MPLEINQSISQPVARQPVQGGGMGRRCRRRHGEEVQEEAQGRGVGRRHGEETWGGGTDRRQQLLAGQ